MKAGESNHNVLISPESGQQEFVCAGATVEKYPLVIASRYNIPFLLDKPGTGHVR